MSLIVLPEFQLPLLMLYAEIHYKFFPLFPSLLFKREPEILFDLPHRVDPGKALPILLIINDIDRFKVEPVEVAITLSQIGSSIQLFNFNELTTHILKHPLSHTQHAYLFTIPAGKLPCGELFVNAKVTLKKGSRTLTVFNDNIPGSSRKAFRTFIADNPLPGTTLCSYGDLHVHSQYSQSHVEFGPPLQVIDSMADACGLSFTGIADHSYDLSCSLSNYLEEDEALPRWQQLQTAHSNCPPFSTILIPGEEISCGNSNNETVHLVGLGHHTFIPGSKDGARKKLRFKQQLSINEAVKAITKENGIAFAAHPCSRSGFLQRAFLHRGHWHKHDFPRGIHGIQALNNGFSRSWRDGKALWIELLQQGERLPLLAGNDAHGDFSRYRAIKKPFLSIYENFQRFMGYAKTGLYGQCSSINDVLDTVKQGATFVTTGPYLSINSSENPQSYSIGKSPSTTDSANNQRYIHALSSSEFGRLQSIEVFFGTTNAPGNKEITLFKSTPSTPTYNLMLPVDCSKVPKGGYLRAEAQTITYEGIINKAITSASYVD